MVGFEESWLAAVSSQKGGPPSPDLQPMVRAVYCDIIAEPPRIIALKGNLEALLAYLRDEGRTTANCWTTDLFFGWSESWERDWDEQNLPDALHDVLAMMGEALHDTVEAPTVAENFGCLPEQLLDRIRQIKIPSP
jgi:hypothetical protein